MVLVGAGAAGDTAGVVGCCPKRVFAGFCLACHAARRPVDKILSGVTGFAGDKRLDLFPRQRIVTRLRTDDADDGPALVNPVFCQ